MEKIESTFRTLRSSADRQHKVSQGSTALHSQTANAKTGQEQLIHFSRKHVNFTVIMERGGANLFSSAPPLGHPRNDSIRAAGGAVRTIRGISIEETNNTHAG